MPTLKISLSEDQQAHLKDIAGRAGFESESEYIAFLIQFDQLKRRREHIDALLQQGLDSGPGRELTDEVWDEINTKALGKRSRSRTRPRK